MAEVCGGRHQATGGGGGGGRGLPPRGTPTSVQRLALCGVASEFAPLPDCPVDVTVGIAVLGHELGYDDDTATGKPALFKRGLVSLPRIQAGLVPMCSVVPLTVYSLLEHDATSPLLQRDCAERFEGKLAFDARRRGNLRLYGSLETCTQRFDHDGHRWSTCRPFVVPKKTVTSA